MTANPVVIRCFLMAAMVCGIWFLPAKAVTAAPFCVEAQGVPSACWYYDVKKCREEAARHAGRCAVNLEEIEISGVGATYCLIDSAIKPWCAFQSGASCEEEADRNSAAICFQNTSYENNDPYRFDRIRIGQ